MRRRLNKLLRRELWWVHSISSMTRLMCLGKNTWTVRLSFLGTRTETAVWWSVDALPPLSMLRNKSASLLLKKDKINKMQRMISGGLIKFSIEYITFCIKTFLAVTKTTTRPNGLMKQILAIFSFGQQTQRLRRLVGIRVMSGDWKGSQQPLGDLWPYVFLHFSKFVFTDVR